MLFGRNEKPEPRGHFGVFPHNCRHTWATWHYAANRDIIGLMKLGDWKSDKMVLCYAT